jgi:general secretion pathway protein G
VLVISLLASVAMVRLGLVQGNGVAATAQLENLNVALTSYQAKGGVYPSQEQGLAALMVRPTTPPVPRAWTSLLLTLLRDPWNRPYVYRVPGTVPGKEYDLSSLGLGRVAEPG